MRHLYFLFLFVTFLMACKKDKGALNEPKIDIYMLTSFAIKHDLTTSPATLSITDAVLSDPILVADKDIISYDQTSATFKLKNNILPIIRDYSSNKGFALTVNKKPIYFGIFHPAYLSSMIVGIPTIDPVFYTIKNELTMNYVLFSGSNYLSQIDKRNDVQIIDALMQTGRLK